MHADLDTLCTVVYCTADDLLPEARRNARCRLTDAEVVTLCVAQAIMGITSNRRFLAVARKRLVHLFPCLPGQAGYHKRRRRLTETIEWLLAHIAAQSLGASDELLLIESIFWTCKDLLTLKRHRVPWPACASASWRASSAWRPASVSTAGWGDQALPSSTTAPEAVGVESII